MAKADALVAHEDVQQLKEDYHHEWHAEEAYLDWQRIELMIDQAIQAVLHILTFQEVRK